MWSNGMQIGVTSEDDQTGVVLGADRGGLALWVINNGQENMLWSGH